MSTHEDFDRRAEIKGSSDRAFGLVFAAAFALIGAWPMLDGVAPRWWALVIAGACGVLAVAAPGILAPANRLWLRLGLFLSRIVNPLVTGLVFYLAVTPTGILMRLLGKDPLRLRIDPDAESYWIKRRPPGPAPDSMSRQF